MNKIKVLYLLEDFGIGGLERIVEATFNGLSRKRFAPSIWCIAGGGELAETFVRKGKNLRLLNLKTYHNPFNILRLCLLIKKDRFHIVHTHGYFASTMGRISAYLAGTPVIISHVHTTYWDFSKRHLWVERLLSRVTDRILCCSNAVRDFVIVNERIDPRKVITVYNGIQGKEENSRVSGEDSSGRTETSIVTTGSLVGNKGHRYLIEALSKVAKQDSGITLTIMGDGPLKGRLEDYAQQLGIGGQTNFLGLVDDVQPILRKADLFVLPSIEREGLGLGIIEAMSQGKPVIGTDIGGIPELIEDGVNGYLVKPRDADGLAAKLKVLIDDKAQRVRMGVEGRRRFEETFDAAIMLQQIEHLYESLVRHKSGGVWDILYLHNKTNISGGEQSLINLWRNLDRTSFTPHLIIPHEGSLGHEAKNLDLNVEYCPIPQFRMKNLFSLVKSFASVRKYCKREKIRLIHSYTPRNNVMAAMIGRIMGIPVIWHERNLIFGPEKDVSRRLSFLPDRIICNSQAVADRFKRGGKIPARVSVVLNGVDLEQFRPKKINEAIRKRYSINGDKIVGLISNVSRRKMPEYLLDAAPYIVERCPQTLFFVVGGEFGEEDKGRMDELAEKARILGVRDHLVFTGFLWDVADIIQVFDIGLAVAEHEACSRAILEMMACGKPVVAFDTGGNNELVDDGVTGTLVDFGDIEGLASSVVSLIENDQRRKTMGMRARERAEGYFDVQVNAERTQEIYVNLIDQACTGT
jgi:glycosyltransferase involved in cell wall biosynthesis